MRASTRPRVDPKVFISDGTLLFKIALKFQTPWL